MRRKTTPNKDSVFHGIRVRNTLPVNGAGSTLEIGKRSLVDLVPIDDSQLFMEALTDFHLLSVVGCDFQ